MAFLEKLVLQIQDIRHFYGHNRNQSIHYCRLDDSHFSLKNFVCGLREKFHTSMGFTIGEGRASGLGRAQFGSTDGGNLACPLHFIVWQTKKVTGYCCFSRSNSFLRLQYSSQASTVGTKRLSHAMAESALTFFLGKFYIRALNFLNQEVIFPKNKEYSWHDSHL